MVVLGALGCVGKSSSIGDPIDGSTGAGATGSDDATTVPANPSGPDTVGDGSTTGDIGMVEDSGSSSGDTGAPLEELLGRYSSGFAFTYVHVCGEDEDRLIEGDLPGYEFCQNEAWVRVRGRRGTIPDDHLGLLDVELLEGPCSVGSCDDPEAALSDCSDFATVCAAPLPPRCGLFAQNCGEGRKCTMIGTAFDGDQLPEIDCVPDGTAAIGDPCTRTAEADECVAGALCVADTPDGFGPGTCRAWCSNWEPPGCPGDLYCNDLFSPVGVCGPA